MARPSATSRATSPYTGRLTKLRRAMAAHGLAHALITNPNDVAYLTGFLGGDSYLIVGPNKPILISDSRYEEELAAFAPIARIVMRTGSILAKTAEVLAEIRDAGTLETLGVQAEHFTLHAERVFKSFFRKHKLPARLLTPVNGLVADLRLIKDDEEVKLIRRAVRIQQEAMEALIPTIKPGQTELEICARLEFEMKARGSVKPSFDTIVGAQANGSLPHYTPGTKKTAAGKPLLIDWGAMWQGYHSDMTRTFTLGKWSKPMREIYEIVREAHEVSAALLAAGRTNHEIDAAARSVIDKAGYGDRFGHGLGHGIGLDVHEGPSVSGRGPAITLEPGMVVTIEPGIYLPGIGGVRLENDYLVTERGSKNLCSLPMTLDWATL
jgi:Xaa-Pro aminopeptidase